MRARTSWPSTLSPWSKAPATSASPPVFAYGLISELSMQTFNGTTRCSLANAQSSPPKTWCDPWSTVARWGQQTLWLGTARPTITSGLYATRCSYQHQTLRQPIDERYAGSGHGTRPGRTAQGVDGTSLQTRDSVR